MSNPVGVNLNGLSLQGVDANGTQWRCNEIVNWWSPPETTSSFEQRAYRDGEWFERPFSRGLNTGVRGRVYAKSRPQALEAVRLLISGIPARGLAPLSLTMDGDQSFRFVLQSGQPEIDWVTDTLVNFYIPLHAPDSRQFVGDGSVEFTMSAATGLPSSVGGLKLPVKAPFRIGAVVTSGQVTITSAGETPRCQLIITGPVQTPRVIDSTANRTMTFNLNLDTGQSLLIDLDKHTVMLNGQASVRNKMSGRWIVPTNGTVLKFDAAAYNTVAQLVAVWTPARR